MPNPRAPFRSALSLALALALGASAATLAETSPAPAAKTIVLVRHGHYDADPAAGELGPGLTPLGVAQARLAGARLAGLPLAFDAFLASPLTRAHETARLIADDLGLPPEVTPALAECTPPTWRTADVADETPEAMAACAAKLDQLFAERFRPAAGAERRELLVCHGNVIRYLVTKALGVETKAWLEMSVGHASLTVVRVEPSGKFKVIAVGDVGHVPPNLQTGSTGQAPRTLSVPASMPASVPAPSAPPAMPPGR
jgi:serine/threonine-protein phosphatase PGAM5